MSICQIRDHTSESFRCVVAALLAALMTTPLALSADSVEIRHDLGQVTVAAGPKRIVAFDLSILDSIDRLGVLGISYAVPKQNLPPYLAKYKAAAVVDAGGMKEPNLERIYEFQPDVIFISARQTDYHEKLSQIAPTVCANVDYDDFLPSFRRNMAMLGDLLLVPDQARALADEVAGKALATAEKAAGSGKQGLIVMVNDGALSVYGPGSRFGVIHDVLKVPSADPGIAVSIHGQSVDFEYLARIDPDLLFVINRNMAIGANGASGVLDNELVKRTKAGKNGGIVNLDSSVWYLSGAGLESLPIMIDEIDKALD